MKKTGKKDVALAGGIKYIIQKLESAETFVLAEAPTLCTEIVASSIIDCVVFMIGSVLFLIGSLLAYSYIPEPTSNYDSLPRLIEAVLIVVGTASTACTISSLNSLMKIMMCPKLTVLEYLHNLISSKED